MLKIAFVAVALMVSGSVSANEAATPVPPHHPGCPDGNCNPPTRETCFNLVCYYNTEEGPYKACRVSARFDKKVTLGGGEVADESTVENNPQFEVACDGSLLFNNSARRFTDMLGTRIQGESGPYPAITLPRGALHTGKRPNSAGYHVAVSDLQLDTSYSQLKIKGLCHIWSGAP